MKNAEFITLHNRAVKKKQLENQQLLAQFRKVAERAILGVIVDTCNRAMIPYMRNYNTKVVTVRGANIFAKVPKDQLGKPDVTVLGLRARTLWIETKASDGQLSEDQERWRDWIVKRGHEYYAPRTIDEAHAVSARILEIGR